MNSLKHEKRIQTTLRIPREIDEAIAKIAKEMGISKNAYIVMVLNQFISVQTKSA